MILRIQFLAVFLWMAVAAHAVDIAHTIVPSGGALAYKFEVTDTLYPPYYADPDTDTWPESGYSYTWHTDEGAVSNAEQPTFFFATPGSHDVHLTLTPRKRGDEDLKVSAVYNFTVDVSTISSNSNNILAHLDMYLDGEARNGDKILVVVPLNSCQHLGSNQHYSIGYDDSKLQFLGMLSQSNLTGVGTSTHGDVALGAPLNKLVHFSYYWPSIRYDKAAIIEFKVLADRKAPVVLKFNQTKPFSCGSDVPISFSTISGPYDPNYKVSDITEINVQADPSKKNSTTEVFYTIHFQNIGDGPVDSVTIVDILPPYLHFLSFEGSSEPAPLVTTSVTGSTLQWIIAPNADIKGTNESPAQPEPDTKGWVKFKAEISKEKHITYDTCYCLANQATIYFDSLSPITTEADVIVIGDSLCFSPTTAGPSFAETFCNPLPYGTPTKRDLKEAPKEDMAVTFFPNPFHDVIRWSGDLGEVQSIVILNAMGQQVTPVSIGANEIQLGNQPPGLYFIRMVTDRGQHVERVLKR